MNTTHERGASRPDWMTKIDAYLNRAADVLLDRAEKLAKDLDDVAKSVAQRLSRTRN